MKLMIIAVSSLLSLNAFAGGGNTDAPRSKTLAIVGCWDPNFEQHLNPNHFNISQRVDRVTGEGQAISLIYSFRGLKSGTSTLTPVSPTSFSGDGIQVNFEAASSKADIVVEGRTFELSCAAMVNNGSEPTRLDSALREASIQEAVSVLSTR